MFAYAGTFSKPATGGLFNGTGEGIHCYRADRAQGPLVPLGTVALADPSFVAVLPERRLLLAASHSWRFEGRPGAGITSFSIGSDGRLSKINAQRLAHPHATMLACDPAQRFVFVAGSIGGAVTALPLRNNGSLGPATDTTELGGRTLLGIGEVPEAVPWPNSPNLMIPRLPEFGDTNIPHCVLTGVAGDWLVVADYGASAISVLGFDYASGSFTSRRRFPLGRTAAPRFLALHANRHTFYAINELESTVSVFEIDPASGEVTEVQNLPSLPPGVAVRNTGSGILLHPDGKFLWACNRGHDSISTFSVAPDGRLAFAGNVAAGGRSPWHLALTPDRRCLYASNTFGATLAGFAIEHDSGALAPCTAVDVPATSCAFL
jgi:6-phosphogluconolactonase (cycloisomerase 2 family)